MEKVLSVLLVEDDVEACEELQGYTDSVEDVEIAATTNNSTDALEMVQTYLPDVVILDLELHFGGGNGLLFLLGLKQLELQVRPYILVTTNNMSQVTFESARQLGADFILAKYENEYSAQYVIEFIRMMKDIITGQRPGQRESSPKRTPNQTESFIRQRIQREITLIGISPKAVGFQYLIDAIYLTIKKPEPNLSRILAQKYRKSDASIERAMQNAINRAWRTSNPEDLLTYYTARIRSDRGVPTMMEFIYYYARKVQSDIDAGVGMDDVGKRVR